MTYNNKKILSITFPILLSLLAQNCLGVIDTIFLARVGEIELGAAAFGNIMYSCIFTIAFGFSMGTQIIISRRNGENRLLEIGPLIQQGFIFSIAIAFLVIILATLFSHNLFSVFISSDNVLDSTCEYFSIRKYGFIFSFCTTIFSAFYIGIVNTKILTINSIIITTINIILDYLLIFGYSYIPALGLNGAAYATVIAEISSIIIYSTYTLLKIKYKDYALNYLHKFDVKLLFHVLKISIFTMFQYLLSMTCNFVFLICIEKLGETQLAMANIVRNIFAVLSIPIVAFSSTISTIVGNIIGTGDIDSVFKTINKIATICLICILPFTVISFVIPENIVSIYTSNKIIQETSNYSIYIISIALLIGSYSYIFFSAISGTGNTKIALYIDIICISLYCIYVSILYSIHISHVEIFFFAEVLYSTILLILSYLYIKRARWWKLKV